MLLAMGSLIAGIKPKLAVPKGCVLATRRHVGVRGGVQGEGCGPIVAAADKLYWAPLFSLGVKLRHVGVVIPEVIREGAEVDGVGVELAGGPGLRPTEGCPGADGHTMVLPSGGT